MDLAQGHVDALAALEKVETFAVSGSADASGFGGSGGKYKAYNLGKGKGMSVLEMVAAMKAASGFEYKYEIIGRRFVLVSLSPSLRLVGIRTDDKSERIEREMYRILRLIQLLLKPNWDSRHLEF